MLPFTILSRIEDGTTTRPQDGSTREDALPPGSIPHALFFVSHWTLEQEINNPLLFRLSLTKLSALPSLDGQQLPRRWPVGGGTFRRTGSAHCRLLRLGECRAAQRLGCRHCKACSPLPGYPPAHRPARRASLARGGAGASAADRGSLPMRPCLEYSGWLGPGKQTHAFSCTNVWHVFFFLRKCRGEAN